MSDPTRRDVRAAPYQLLADLWPKWDNVVRYDQEVLSALEMALHRGYQEGYADGQRHAKPVGRQGGKRAQLPKGRKHVASTSR